MKEITQLDMEFNSQIMNLYTIYDMTTNLDVAPVVSAPNDLTAVSTFLSFLEDNKEKKAAYSCYALKTVGVYDCCKHEIVNDDSYEIISEKEDVQQYYDDIIKFIKSQNSLEEYM